MVVIFYFDNLNVLSLVLEVLLLLTFKKANFSFWCIHVSPVSNFKHVPACPVSISVQRTMQCDVHFNRPSLPKWLRDLVFSGTRSPFIFLSVDFINFSLPGISFYFMTAKKLSLSVGHCWPNDKRTNILFQLNLFYSFCAALPLIWFI